VGGDLAGVVLGVTSSNQTLLPAANLSLTGTGASRQVLLTPAAHHAGQTTITITATDAPNHSVQQSFLLTVTDGPPSISAIGNQTIAEGHTLGSLTFTVDDDVTPLATLVVTATSSNTALLANGNITIGGSSASRTLSATPGATASGTTTITVSVSDGSQVATSAFTLTVTPKPPDPPTPPDPPAPPDPPGPHDPPQPPDPPAPPAPPTPPPTPPGGPGAIVYSLAEGATGGFFDTDILIANPNAVAAPVMITFYKDDGTTVVQNRTLAATSRTTIHVKDVAGLWTAAFSTTVSSTSGQPLAVERTMWWDASGYGSHGEKASAGPATTWYFAEGSQGYFHTYYLLLNPQTTPNVAHVAYFLDDGSPLQRDYPLLAASRTTIDIGTEPALINRSFGAVITFDQPGVAERAMYFGERPLFSGGHDSAGVTSPSTSWFLAEGATGAFFDTFILIANPNDAAAQVVTTYLPTAGAPVAKTHDVAPHQRLTINIADEDPTLASAAVATRVSSDRPVSVERSQYWPHGNWYEAHNSAGEVATGAHWCLAEGRVGGANQAQTYILLANPGDSAATVTLTFLREDGTTIAKTVSVAATSRLNVAITGAASDVPELADEAFGTRIDSTQPIIVERSMYTDANGVTWAAGTNATATRLPDPPQ
jgi:hypothetical protein